MEHPISQPTPDGIAFPFSELPPPGGAIEVARGVFWLRMPLPFALDHINLWLIADGEGWCVVDTGLNFAPARERWTAARQGILQGRPIQRVIVTHYHPDHIGLACWLAGQADCRIWMNAREHQAAVQVFNEDPGVRLDFFRRHGLDDQQLDALGDWGSAYRRNVSGLPEAPVELRDGQLLRIGDHDWRVIIGRGHSPEHATLHCPDLGVLLAGDQILPKITPHVGVWHFDPEADPVRLFLASLANFRALPAQTLVLPAHGIPFTGLTARLDYLAQHHAQRLHDVLEACDGPHSAAELMPTLFRRQLDTQQIPFAMGETIAHLNHLHQQGNLVRSTDANGVFRFERRH